MADQHHSGRGGHREGAGRPEGAKDKAPRIKRSDKTELLRERITPTEKAQLREYLRKLRGESQNESR